MKAKGFTMLEVIIGAIIGVFVAATVMYIFTNFSLKLYTSIEETKCRTQVYDFITNISKEVQSSGFLETTGASLSIIIGSGEMIYTVKDGGLYESGSDRVLFEVVEKDDGKYFEEVIGSNGKAIAVKINIVPKGMKNFEIDLLLNRRVIEG